MCYFFPSDDNFDSVSILSTSHQLLIWISRIMNILLFNKKRTVIQDHVILWFGWCQNLVLLTGTQVPSQTNYVQKNATPMMDIP